MPAPPFNVGAGIAIQPVVELVARQIDRSGLERVTALRNLLLDVYLLLDLAVVDHRYPLAAVGLNAPGGDRMLCTTSDAVVIKQRDDHNEAGLGGDGGHVIPPFSAPGVQSEERLACGDLAGLQQPGQIVAAVLPRATDCVGALSLGQFCVPPLPLCSISCL